LTTALDLIGHNAALQEHWFRRFVAAIVDGLLLGLASAIFALPFPFLWVNWWAWSLLWGVIALLYYTLLEASIGATIGKKLLSLRVVAIDGPMDASRALIRNITKIHGILLLLDLLVGGVTHGDPRQRYADRLARTSVTRVDQGAYMEEQFRMMQHTPMYPQAPPGTYPAAPPPGGMPPAQSPAAPQAPPPGQAPPPSGGWPAAAGGWPGQAPPQQQWPKHEWDEEGKLKPQMRFCTQCGGQLVARGDGRMTCVRCGAVY